MPLPTTATEARALLYDAGKYQEALRTATSVLADFQGSEEECQEWCALEAWCQYQLRQFDKAEEAAQRADNNEWGAVCLASIYAYSTSGLQDETKLAAIANEYPDNPGVINAQMVYARSSIGIGHDKVVHMASNIFNDSSIAAAHAMHNAGRFFSEKARGLSDQLTALGFYEQALVRYGNASNLRHRAAVWFWKSRLLEGMNGPEQALTAAETALRLRGRQFLIDSTNDAIRKEFEQAVQRVKDLTVAIVGKTIKPS